MVENKQSHPIDAQKLREISEWLLGGLGTFSWDSTEQGFEYWEDVCFNLEDIAKNAERCPTCHQKVENR